MPGKPYKRTRHDLQRVKDLLAVERIPIWKIAELLGISDETLHRHYEDEIADADRKSGRRPFDPSDAQRKTVRLMAAIGTPHDDIAKHLDITPDLLKTHFHEELKMGKIGADTQVAGNLFKMATGPADSKTTVTAAIWWTKARMGWKDTSRVENTGADGGPIRNENSVIIVLPDNGRGDGPTPVDLDHPEIEHESEEPPLFDEEERGTGGALPPPEPEPDEGEAED